jgi:hypothetical protein
LTDKKDGADVAGKFVMPARNARRSPFASAKRIVERKQRGGDFWQGR